MADGQGLALPALPVLPTPGAASWQGMVRALLCRASWWMMNTVLIFCPLTISSDSLHLHFDPKHLPPFVSYTAENASAAG